MAERKWRRRWGNGIPMQWEVEGSERKRGSEEEGGVVGSQKKKLIEEDEEWDEKLEVKRVLWDFRNLVGVGN